VSEQRLHQLIRQPNPVVEHQFEIEFLGSGVEAFAFTFG
jgi:Thioredoxin like C-terminal domain